MQDKLIYFLSDFHLGARYLEKPSDYEKRVVGFLDAIKDTAKEIYLLGDILDYWYEYKHVIPKGFVRFFGKLAELTDAGIAVYWFLGNHDIWIFDYLPQELGITVVDGPLIKEIGGKRFLLDHGDGVGRQKRSFRILRSLFRNKFCQTLYAAIHPRWSVPFALRWSEGSRQGDIFPQYLGENNEYLEEFAQNYRSVPEIDFFVFGHRHIMLDKKLPNGGKLVILGDWIHFCSYAVFDGENLSLKTYSGKLQPAFLNK